MEIKRAFVGYFDFVAALFSATVNFDLRFKNEEEKKAFEDVDVTFEDELIAKAKEDEGAEKARLMDLLLGAFMFRPRAEAFAKRAKIVGVRWVDTRKGDKVRSSLVH